MKHLLVYLKGILLGFVGLAIPGLSASTIGLEIGIYYEMIDAISGVIKNFKKNALFLAFLILGYISGGFIGSFAVDTVYKNFPLVMVLVITGFVLGGVPEAILKLKGGEKKLSCWLSMLIVAVFLVCFSFLITEGKPVSFDNMGIKDYIILFFVGIFTSSTLVIPGVDFAVLFIAIGYYQAFTNLFAHIYEINNIVHNGSILIVYAVGYGIGGFALSKLIKRLIGRFRLQTEYASFAFIAIAPVIIVKKNVIEGFNTGTFFTSTAQWIIGLILFVVVFISMILVLKRFRSSEKDLLDNMEKDTKEKTEKEK